MHRMGPKRTCRGGEGCSSIGSERPTRKNGVNSSVSRQEWLGGSSRFKLRPVMLTTLADGLTIWDIAHLAEA